VKFNKLTYEQRLVIWRHAMEKHGLTAILNESDLASFAASYESNAGGIDVALKNTAMAIKGGESSIRPCDMVHRVMRSHLAIRPLCPTRL